MSPPRSLQRILAEAAFVLIVAGAVLGLCLESGLPNVGWILALIICAIGAPALEILRLRNP